jgi:hypothetical protein
MANLEVPTDDEVIATLRGLGGSTTALKLCDALMKNDHPRLQSQLAIQRTAERGKIHVWSDWSINLKRERARESVAA